MFFRVQHVSVETVESGALLVRERTYRAGPIRRTQRLGQGRQHTGPLAGRRGFQAIEVDDAAKPELLRRYLDRWYWQVKEHIAGLTPDSSPAQIAAAAPSIPVFVLQADA